MNHRHSESKTIRETIIEACSAIIRDSDKPESQDKTLANRMIQVGELCLAEIADKNRFAEKSAEGLKEISKSQMSDVYHEVTIKKFGDNQCEVKIADIRSRIETVLVPDLETIETIASDCRDCLSKGHEFQVRINAIGQIIDNWISQ